MLNWFVVVGTAILMTPPPSGPGGVFGLWLNEEGDAAIRIDTCGELLCGRIVWVLEPRDESGKIRTDVENRDEMLRSRPIIGLAILTGFPVEPSSGQKWKGGRVYDPKNGKTYRSRIELDSGDVLKLRGYIGISLLGRTTTWTRVTEDQFPDG